MPSKVDVMNGALFALGQEPVTDLTQNSIDQSNAALKLLRHIDVARDLVLARHGWACALDYAELAPVIIPDYSNWRYPYVYQLAPAALNVWEIERCQWSSIYGWGPHGDRWEVGTIDTDIGARKIIRSFDASTLNVVSVMRRRWEALDVHIADTIALALAARGAKSVTGSADSSLDQKAEAQLMVAIGVDGTQARGQDMLGPSRPAMIRRRMAF